MAIKGNLGGIPVGDDKPTCLIGIINLSPTSFYKGSIKTSKNDISTQLRKLIDAGANVIDVGAISSAPTFIYKNQEIFSTEKEIERLSTFFNVYDELGIQIPISIDTQSRKTAKYVLSKGATIINDISGFKSDPKLPLVISDFDASAIVMACRKLPGDVFSIDDILIELENSIKIGIDAGINRKNIIIDPGLGGWVPQRQIEDDFKIIINLRKFRQLKQCILLGISRKSFIGKILDVPPDKRLWGSLAATSIAVMNGAHILRTHDVQETLDVCRVIEFMKKMG